MEAEDRLCWFFLLNKNCIQALRAGRLEHQRRGKQAQVLLPLCFLAFFEVVVFVVD